MVTCAAIFYMSTKRRLVHCLLQPNIGVIIVVIAVELLCTINIFCCSKTLGGVVDHCGGHLVLPPSYMLGFSLSVALFSLVFYINKDFAMQQCF
jgi:hypothetical protein